MTTMIQNVLSGTRNLAFMFVAALGLAGCSPPASAGTYDCVPVNAKTAGDLRKVHGALLLSEGATQEIAGSLKAAGKKPAAVLVVDEDGHVHTFLPSGQSSKLCKFKFPLKAAEMAAGNTLSVFRTTNPKFCWYDSNGNYKCIEY